MNILSPFFKSPLTDVMICNAPIDHQYFGRCADFEMKTIDCMEAYGVDRGLRECKDLYTDFKACASRNNDVRRIRAMAAERRRQYQNGERTKENRYAPSPKHDIY